jgi:plastocyanin
MATPNIALHPTRVVRARSLGTAGLVVAAAGWVNACVSDRPTDAEPPVVAAAVSIENFAFAPPALNAATGTVVRWTNKDDVAHTVSADDGTSFDSDPVSKDGTFELTAGAPGTYTYFCRIHPFMKGTLIVTP